MQKGVCDMRQIFLPTDEIFLCSGSSSTASGMFTNEGVNKYPYYKSSAKNDFSHTTMVDYIFASRQKVAMRFIKYINLTFIFELHNDVFLGLLGHHCSISLHWE